jgi:myo-inositol-1(or 4)-monophosphatase
MSDRPGFTERAAVLARLSADCLEIAERASAVALRGFRARPDVSEKSAQDLVTAFDVEAQELAITLFAERHPGVPVVAEEGGTPGMAPPSGLAFVIDPIDGTTNFAYGHPFWCVSIGALLDGEPAVGAVVAPCIATRWHGYRAREGALSLRNGVPCKVSERSRLDEALVATGFPPERFESPYNNFDSFVSVKRAARAVRRCGSAAIDICFVADGTYDGYWERRLHLWDAAAGSALVLAGGGKITALDGSPPVYERGHLVVTNGRIHNALVSAVAG